MREKKRVAVYVRVSTDGQAVENQLRDLRSAAKRQLGIGVGTVQRIVQA